MISDQVPQVHHLYPAAPTSPIEDVSPLRISSLWQLVLPGISGEIKLLCEYQEERCDNHKKDLDALEKAKLGQSHDPQSKWP